MADIVNVGKNAMNVTKSDLHIPYSKVIITVGEEERDDEVVVIQYEAGDDTGLTLELNCPFGTQAMADNILANIQNKRYKPYTVNSALIDPAAEIGDAVNTNAVFGGLYSQKTTFGHGFYSDYSAPEDEQMNHEYKYETQTERRITRESLETKAMFKATNTKIEARVSKTGGDNTSFGWELVENYFKLYSGSTAVFTCNSSGLSVNGNGTFTGTITAKSGRIGANSSGTGGFIIEANKLYTDGHPAYDTNAGGVYVGTDGIGCGAAKFYVTSAGKLTATDVDISGKITATSGTFHGGITCSSISFDNGVTINGSNITNGSIADGKISDISGSKVGSGIAGGNINEGTVGSGQLGSGSVTRPKGSTNVRTSLDNGDTAKASYDSLVSGSVTATWLKANSVTAGTLRVNRNGVGLIASWQSATISGTTIYYLGRTSW